MADKNIFDGLGKGIRDLFNNYYERKAMRGTEMLRIQYLMTYAAAHPDKDMQTVLNETLSPDSDFYKKYMKTRPKGTDLAQEKEFLADLKAELEKFAELEIGPEDSKTKLNEIAPDNGGAARAFNLIADYLENPVSRGEGQGKGYSLEMADQLREKTTDENRYIQEGSTNKKGQERNIQFNTREGFDVKTTFERLNPFDSAPGENRDHRWSKLLQNLGSDKSLKDLYPDLNLFELRELTNNVRERWFDKENVPKAPNVEKITEYNLKLDKAFAMATEFGGLQGYNALGSLTLAGGGDEMLKEIGKVGNSKAFWEVMEQQALREGFYERYFEAPFRESNSGAGNINNEAFTQMQKAFDAENLVRVQRLILERAEITLGEDGTLDDDQKAKLKAAYGVEELPKNVRDPLAQGVLYLEYRRAASVATANGVEVDDVYAAALDGKGSELTMNFEQYAPLEEIDVSKAVERFREKDLQRDAEEMTGGFTPEVLFVQIFEGRERDAATVDDIYAMVGNPAVMEVYGDDRRFNDFKEFLVQQHLKVEAEIKAWDKTNPSPTPEQLSERPVPFKDRSARDLMLDKDGNGKADYLDLAAQIEISEEKRLTLPEYLRPAIHNYEDLLKVPTYGEEAFDISRLNKRDLQRAVENSSYPASGKDKAYDAKTLGRVIPNNSELERVLSYDASDPNSAFINAKQFEAMVQPGELLNRAFISAKGTAPAAGIVQDAATEMNTMREAVRGHLAGKLFKELGLHGNLNPQAFEREAMGFIKGYHGKINQQGEVSPLPTVEALAGSLNLDFEKLDTDHKKSLQDFLDNMRVVEDFETVPLTLRGKDKERLVIDVYDNADWHKRGARGAAVENHMNPQTTFEAMGEAVERYREISLQMPLEKAKGYDFTNVPQFNAKATNFGRDKLSQGNNQNQNAPGGPSAGGGFNPFSLAYNPTSMKEEDYLSLAINAVIAGKATDDGRLTQIFKAQGFKAEWNTVGNDNKITITNEDGREVASYTKETLLKAIQDSTNIDDATKKTLEQAINGRDGDKQLIEKQANTIALQQGRINLLETTLKDNNIEVPGAAAGSPAASATTNTATTDPSAGTTTNGTTTGAARADNVTTDFPKFASDKSFTNFVNAVHGLTVGLDKEEGSTGSRYGAEEIARALSGDKVLDENDKALFDNVFGAGTFDRLDQDKDGVIEKDEEKALEQAYLNLDAAKQKLIVSTDIKELTDRFLERAVAEGRELKDIKAEEIGTAVGYAIARGEKAEADITMEQELENIKADKYFAQSNNDFINATAAFGTSVIKNTKTTTPGK